MRKGLTKFQQQEYKKLAHNVRMFRSEKGWTQMKAAKKCGVCFNTYAGIEQANCNPRADVLIKIAKGLGTKVDDLWLWLREDEL